MVELLFMLVILKLPIVYIGAVCYWAIKAEPKPPETARMTAVPSEPCPFPHRPRHRPRNGPHGGPVRREARAGRALAAR